MTVIPLLENDDVRTIHITSLDNTLTSTFIALPFRVAYETV